MKFKPLLIFSYRAIEILLILSVTIGIFAIGINSHDSAEMGGLLSPCIVAFAWMWFISLPLFIIYIASSMFNSTCFDLQEDGFVTPYP